MAINQYLSTCTLVNNMGTGIGTCDFKDLADLTGIDLAEKEVKFNFADATPETTYNNYVLAKKLFPLNELFNFEQNTPDNEYATSSTGIKVNVRDGKIEFTITFNESNCFHKAIFLKKSFGKYNFFFKFTGNYAGAKTTDGLSLKGFDGGMFDVSSFKITQGTDKQNTKVMFQLTPVGTQEWNTRLTAISNENLGFDPNLVEGVIETNVSYVSAPVAGTSIVVDVVSACSGEAITGLTGSDKWKLGGVQATPTTITATESVSVAGRYTLTLADALVSNDTVQPLLNNGTYNAVEDITGNKYAGQATLATIA